MNLPSQCRGFYILLFYRKEGCIALSTSQNLAKELTITRNVCAALNKKWNVMLTVYLLTVYLVAVGFS